MSWKKITDETRQLKKSIATILEMKLNGSDWKYKITMQERPPNLSVTLWIETIDERRAYTYDAHGERATNITDQELDILADIMGEIYDLPSVYILKKQWIADGLLTYTVGINYALYLKRI